MRAAALGPTIDAMRGVTVRRVLLGVVAFVLGLFGLQLPAHAGGVFIVITGIHVGSPVMGTQDSCNGWVQHNVPVVPVTINAAFFGDDPVGPYATAEWGGGFGSSDDHFGTGVAHDHYQHFHILVRASTLSGWHGADTYWFQGLVQDVGLGGGFAVRTKDVYLPPPSPTVAKVKCTIVPPLGPQYVLDQVKDAALDKLKELACEACMKVKGFYDMLQGYSDALDGVMYDSMVDDPPDPDFQTLATPTPAPVLPAPDGATQAEQTAYIQLATQLATDLGIGRAIYATVNRVWGADNAANTFWHRKQLSNLATLTGQMATGLDALPPLWTAMVESLTGLPGFTVGPRDVDATMTGIDQGVKPERKAVLTQLGVSDSDQRAIAELFATYVDPLDVPTTSSTDALSGNNATALAAAMRIWQKWALSAVEDDPPVVTSVSPGTLPSSGGTAVTVEGSHLQHVTGINFGPSSPGHAQGDLLNCTATQCDAYAPPGHGTVDVVAVGPGGTSKITPGDQVTYSEPDVPHVSGVYPAVGPLAGNNAVSVFGSGLAGGRVDFGTVPAQSWRCQPTKCTATVPASGLAGPVNVTVLNGTNRSTTSPADLYTYSTTAPPPPGTPTVTQVSPSTGTHLGGQQITITGTNFTRATEVDFGDGYRATDFSVTDDSHITLTTPSMGAGANDVVIYGPGGTSAVTPADVFVATQAAPTVTSISPNTGPDLGGTHVTLTGNNLTDAFIEIGQSFGDDTVCTATQCTFVTRALPQGAPLGPTHTEVSTSDGQNTPSDADLFTFTQGPAPQITGLDPDSGSTAGGGNLVVTGHDLSGGRVTIGGSPADAAGMSQYCSSASCVVKVPAHAAGDVPVVVTTHAGSSAPSDASYSYVRPPRPVVTDVSPSQEWARGVDQVIISGHNLEGGKVFFGSVNAFNADCTSSQCSVPYPPWPDGASTVDITVQTAGGTSATGPQTKFTWIAPTITSVSPASGWNDGSQTVTVTGTNLKGGSITFGNRIANETCASDTTCVVTAPKTSGGATGVVDVIATAEDQSTRSPVTAASTFTYTTRPLPTVTSLSPNHGNLHGKETVMLTGTDLQGATRIAVAGISATIKGCTATSCTFVTPSHAVGAVQVVVTTSAGDSPTGAGSTFTYEAATVPTITSVSPASGSTVGGGTVTLTGIDLSGTVIRFGTSQQSATCDRTSCTVTAGPHVAGTLDVTAQSDAGTSTVTADTKFTYVLPPVPTITGLTPDSGPASGGAAVTLTGTNLRGAQVSFGGAAVTETCTDTQCTFTQLAKPAGDLPVTVTTQGGTSAGKTFHVDPVTLTEHTITGVTSAMGIGEIIRGIGGDLWFAMHDVNKIGRVKSDGSIVTYPTPVGSGPYGITLGPDGRMWFTEPGSSHIGAMDGSGNLTEYPVASAPDDLRFITPGPDGRLWFNLGSGAIGAITTTGQVTEYPVPDATVVPYHVLAGPDGRIWFTEWGGGSIGAITTDGVVSEYPLGAVDLTNWDLKTGPDGRLWFTQTAGQAFAAVDTATGEVTTYRLPADVNDPQGMVWGPDGRFWFVTPNVQRVAAWDPDSDQVTYYPLPTAAVRTPKYIAMDRNGDLWVTEATGQQLLSVTGVPDIGAPTVTWVAPQYGAAGDQITVTGSFLGATQGVTVGGVAATFQVVDPSHLSVTIPAGSGTAPVVVTTAHGASPADPGAVFHYGSPPPPAPVVSSVDPPSGPVAGGNTVTITGSHLAGASIKVGTQPATGVSCTATSCTATVPAGPQGTVDVVATTAAGTSATSPADHYTYLLPAPSAPTVTAISPATGPTDGGTAVTVTGTNLAEGSVWFGTAAASGSCTATSCTVTSPQSGAGVVHVRVSTAGGVSAKVTADRFTYVGSGTTASTTMVSAAPGTVTVGQPVTLTAQVTPAAASGQVVFRDGGATLGTVDLTNATASFQTSTLTVGSHQVTAEYLGDETFAGSTATPITVTINPAPVKQPTTTTLGANPTTGHEGQTVTLTATVNPAAATGTVTFTDDVDGLLGSANVVGGVAAKGVFLDAGNHHITASYSGSTGYEPSVSGPVTVTVLPTQPTTTTLTAPATAQLQSPVTFTATVAPAAAPGTVMFFDQTKGLSLGSKPVSGGTASLTTTALGTGQHKVVAFFTSANPAYTSSLSDVVTVTITGAPPPPPPPPAVPGPPLDVKAKANPHAKVTVQWAAPASAGSSPITKYVVLVHLGNKVVKTLATKGPALKLVVSHLMAGKKYAFAVYAVNSVGNGATSALTKAVKVKR